MSRILARKPLLATARSNDALTATILAGVVGLVVWEVFARFVAPRWLGHALDPTGLIEMALGISGMPAQLLHLVTGLVVFPAGYVLVLRPLAGRFVPGLSWPLLGAAYGVALWVFAMYGMASLLGGAPPFLGFGAIAWASLVGHVLLALALAATAALMARRAG